MDFPDLPRRRFLRALVFTGSALALPATALANPPAAPAAGVTLLVLGAHRAAVLTAFAEATLATGNGFPTLAEAEVIARIDEELYFTEPGIRADLLLAIDALEYLPLLYGRFSRLHKLALPQRRAFIDSLADTRLDTVRAAVNGLRLVTGLTYYAHRSCRAAMGHDGPHAGLPPRDDEQRALYRQLSGRQA